MADGDERHYPISNEGLLSGSREALIRPNTLNRQVCFRDPCLL
jgi:hypothetical protein